MKPIYEFFPVPFFVLLPNDCLEPVEPEGIGIRRSPDQKDSSQSAEQSQVAVGLGQERRIPPNYRVIQVAKIPTRLTIRIKTVGAGTRISALSDLHFEPNSFGP
ncbi:unnamed protein product [Protopolystoma xenopodis]|uniref:Uncharacterized protein n=1 Tax=Protopolystoma xenopodis TaxID=117903 RepID=A0A3S5A577_9PLAT|nr:unnamed protein product [Protopolystoma xenopodis]